MRVPPPFHVAVAQWHLGMLTSDQLPTIAIQALEEGRDSPSLRTLAGLTSDETDDAGSLLERAARELGVQVRDSAQAALTVARFVASHITQGTLSPYDGARQIWRLVGNDAPATLLGFVAAASDLHDFMLLRARDPGTYDELIARSEENIRAMARELLAGMSNRGHS